jgi:hypothetical protein
MFFLKVLFIYLFKYYRMIMTSDKWYLFELMKNYFKLNKFYSDYILKLVGLGFTSKLQICKTKALCSS